MSAPHRGGNGALSIEERRSMVLAAKQKYERFHRPEDQEEPSDTYKAMLLELGFTPEQVANWRAFQPDHPGRDGAS